jgi:large subunit ribosomal protein L22
MATVETERREVRAEARYVRAAPRKAALVADQIRGRTVPEARTILTFMTRDAARDVRKVLDSAVANAEANHGLAGDDLYVSAAFVGAGPTLKRWRARARGRVARIKKRTCHITIHLALPSGEEIPAPLPRPAVEAQPIVETPSAEEGAPAEELPAAEESPAAAEDVPKPKPERAPRKKAETTAEQEEKPKPRARKTEKAPDDAAKPARRKPKPKTEKPETEESES